MKISELITKLQAVQAEHGDIDAVVFPQGYATAPGLEVIEPDWREDYEPWVGGIVKVLAV